MKRFIAIALLFCVCISAFSGCKKNKYDPVESTEEESRVIISLKVGENSYDIRYEFYRAFFLTYKSEIDGGDESVWSGENKSEYIDKINEKIISEAAEIFSVFELCKRLRIDLYSDDIEDQINEMIKINVEGGSWGDRTLIGYDGDYEKYLASLKEIYHNYQTSVLLMRYYIGKQLIDDYYIGSALSDDGSGRITDGAIEYTKDKIRDYYNSDESSQILTTFVADEVSYTPTEDAEEIRLEVIAAAKISTNAVRIRMIDLGSPTAVAELESGILIGRNSLSRDYSELAEVADSLSVGEVGRVVKTVSSEYGKRYYIIYKMEKSETFFEENYTAVVQVYLYDTIGTNLAMVAELLKNEATYTENYYNILHSEVRM